MCLAIPAKVIQCDEDDQAVISIGGIQKIISTALISDIQEGDYVIVHVGFALTKVDAREAEKTLAMVAELSL